MTEYHLKALRVLAENPRVSQREMSRRLRLSLGKVNGIISSLMENGYVRMKKSAVPESRRSYMYVLTPSGSKKRMELARRFLMMKKGEHERLSEELRELEEEVSNFRV